MHKIINYLETQSLTDANAYYVMQAIRSGQDPETMILQLIKLLETNNKNLTDQYLKHLTHCVNPIYYPTN